MHSAKFLNTFIGLNFVLSLLATNAFSETVPAEIRPSISFESWVAKNKNDHVLGAKKYYFVRAMMAISNLSAICLNQKGELMEGMPMQSTKGSDLNFVVGCKFPNGNIMKSEVLFVKSTEQNPEIEDNLSINYYVNEVNKGHETSNAKSEYEDYLARGEKIEKIIKSQPVFYSLWH